MAWYIIETPEPTATPAPANEVTPKSAKTRPVVLTADILSYLLIKRRSEGSQYSTALDLKQGDAGSGLGRERTFSLWL
eukprot:c54307_g1_i1 orf=267-500(+)